MMKLLVGAVLFAMVSYIGVDSVSLYSMSRIILSDITNRFTVKC